MVRIAAYRRRRGWQAYWTASLSRFSWKGQVNGIPSLDDMMDVEKPKGKKQDANDMLAALRSWATMSKPH